MATSGEIKVNQRSITGLLGTAKNANSALDASKVKTVPQTSSSNGIMLSRFVQCAYDISAVLNSFSALVNKDLQDINRSINLMMSADQKAADNFK